MALSDKEETLRLLEGMRKKRQLQRLDPVAATAKLRSMVRGQDHVMSEIAELLGLRLAAESRRKPIAVLLFVGPSGVGKTETGKALASVVFESAHKFLHISCEQLNNSPDPMGRLLGADLQYRGAEQGGMLTSKLEKHSECVVLIDEVEKGPPQMLRFFLSIFDEGEYLDPTSHKTVDCRRVIFITTSNLGTKEITKAWTEGQSPKEVSRLAKEIFAKDERFPPEVLGRFDRFFAFKTLSDSVLYDIALDMVRSIAARYGTSVNRVDPAIVARVIQTAGEENGTSGARGLEKAIESATGHALLTAGRVGLQLPVVDLLWEGESIVAKDASAQ